MTTRRFTQLDVFTATPLRGNPLAVVIDADGLSDVQMAEFARWTNLSETTFLLPPTDTAADYRVRIFTPGGELPFAGHPTLGSCHAWLAAGGVPRDATMVVQQCGVGLVRVKRDTAQPARLAFAAPPLRRSGPATDPALRAQVRATLGVADEALLRLQWVDNGPGWLAALLPDAASVLAIKPDFVAMGTLNLGVVGPHPPGSECQWELRAFVPILGVQEDPVTGSLNAGVAQWLIGEGLASDAYVAAQGAALGRAGRVHVQRLGKDVWVGGDTVALVQGSLTL